MMVVGMPSQQELLCYQTWAKNAADSLMYRNVGKEAGIMMIMLAAREYGIGPAQALNGGLHIIEGKVELSARVMSGLIRRAKHKIQILESTDTKCVIRGQRSDTNEMHIVTFTIEMAQKAGLIKDKGGWKRTPEDMLFARAMSRLARQLFSDVIGVGYIEGEISDSKASNEVLEPFPETNTEPHDQDLLVEELYRHFEDKEDQKILGEFIKVVMEHYKWTYYQTIKQLLGDVKELSKKFHSWKNKRKVANEKTIDVASTPVVAS